MVEILKLSPEQILVEKEAQNKAKIAEMDALLAGLFAGMDHDEEERDNETKRRVELAHRKKEPSPTTPLPQSGAIYVDVNAVMGKFSDEGELDGGQDREEYQAPLVKMPTDEGHLWTIPNIEKRLKGDWSEIEYEPLLLRDGPWTEVEDTPLLQLTIRKEDHNALSVELKDLHQEPLRQKRLHGLLLPVIQEKYKGRMSYLPDERFRLHPTAEDLVDVSLSQLLDVVRVKNPRHIEFYQRSYKNQPTGKIGF